MKHINMSLLLIGTLNTVSMLTDQLAFAQIRLGSGIVSSLFFIMIGVFIAAQLRQAIMGMSKRITFLICVLIVVAFLSFALTPSTPHPAFDNSQSSTSQSLFRSSH